jgi:hypothetical protein
MFTVLGVELVSMQVDVWVSVMIFVVFLVTTAR